MLTLTDLTDMVSDALASPVDDSGRITTARVTSAINAGYVRFAKDTECFIRDVTLTLTDGASSFALPGDIYRLLEVRYSGNVLTPMEWRSMDIDRQGWRSEAAGSPDSWTMLNPLSLLLVPPVATASGNTLAVTISYVPSSVTGGIQLLTVSSDKVSLSYLLAPAPAKWAAYYLASRLFPGDDTMAQAGAIALQEYRELVDLFNASTYNGGGYEAD